MKKLITLLFVFAFAHGIAQTNFHFTYYEVYKTKTYDSVGLWKNLKRNDSFNSAGAIYFNGGLKSVRFTLKEDSKFVEHTGVVKSTPTGYILGNGWIMVRDPESENVMGVFKNNYWVVYYKKLPPAQAKR